MHVGTVGVQPDDRHAGVIAEIAIFDGIQRGYAGGVPDLCVGEIDGHLLRIFGVLEMLEQIVAAAEKQRAFHAVTHRLPVRADFPLGIDHMGDAPGDCPSTESVRHSTTEAIRLTLGSTPAITENDITSGISARAVMIPARHSRVSAEGERNTADTEADPAGVFTAVSGEGVIAIFCG